MIAVRKIDDGLVVYLFEDKTLVELNELGLWTEQFTALDLNSHNSELIHGVEKPELFVGGALSYDGSWHLVHQQLIDDNASQSISDFKKSTMAEINLKRDEIIGAGFSHNGHKFQSDQSDRENIIGKGYKAEFAIINGAQHGDLFWDPLTGSNPFVWIAADNQLVPLDAFDMKALKDAGEEFKSRITFFARGLKDSVAAAEGISEVKELLNTQWPSG